MESTQEIAKLNIERSIVLGEYIRQWKLPRLFQGLEMDEGEIELYYFKRDPNVPTWQWATFGLSNILSNEKQQYNLELFIEIDSNEDKDLFKSINIMYANMFIDMVDGILDIRDNDIIVDEKYMPSEWEATHIWFKHTFDPVHIPDHETSKLRCVKLIRIIPLYDPEAEYIAKHGPSLFLEFCENNNINLDHPNRDLSTQFNQ